MDFILCTMAARHWLLLHVFGCSTKKRWGRAAMGVPYFVGLGTGTVYTGSSKSTGGSCLPIGPASAIAPVCSFPLTFAQVARHIVHTK